MAANRRPDKNAIGAKDVDSRTRENWLKVKAALEAAGKTDNDYYRRAVKICAGFSDPGPFQLNTDN